MKKNCQTHFYVVVSFHYIEFPDEATMREIIAVHFPNILEHFGFSEALQVFFKLRQVTNGLKKPPSTSELIDWLSLLMADDMPEDMYCVIMINQKQSRHCMVR